MREAFGTYYPAITFMFFIGAIVFSVIVNNPLWLVTCVVASCAYYLCVRGCKGIKLILGMIPVYCVLAAINPLFNTMGNTILFTYFYGRPYTLEALFFGMQTAGMFVSIMIWFGSYNRVMSSDKFTFLFGGLAPAITLVLTMILRLVPSYMRKTQQIASARRCIGLSISHGSIKERAYDGVTILNALTTWALENSVITADSMRSRGYGAKNKRSQFAQYRFGVRDAVCLCFMIACAIVAIFAIAHGCASAEFIPQIIFPPITPLWIGGYATFTLFLLLPTIIDIQERISWHNSISKI